MDETYGAYADAGNNADDSSCPLMIHVAGAVTDTDETCNAYVAAENPNVNNTNNIDSDSNSNSNSRSNSNSKSNSNSNPLFVIRFPLFVIVIRYSLFVIRYSF